MCQTLVWAANSPLCDAQDVNSLFTLGKVLGRGQFGTTRLATDKKTGKELACKSIGKRKLLWVAQVPFALIADLIR